MKFEHLKESFDPLSFEPMAAAIFTFNPESLHHLASLGDAGFAVLGKGLVDAYHAAKYSDQGLREWSETHQSQD